MISRMTDAAARRRRRAISLTEVVVSVATIGAASAILLPAMGEARRQSKEIHCLSNLGRIANASHNYAATDRNEIAIPVHRLFGQGPGARGEYAWGGKSGRGEPQQGTVPETSRWGTERGRGPGSRALNKILYGDVFPDFWNDPGPNQVNWVNDMKLNLDVFRCPSDYGYTGHHYLAWKDSKLSSYDHYGTSYSAGTSWISFPGPGCTLMSNSAFLRPLSGVPAPGNTLMYMENCGRFGYRENYGGPDDVNCCGLSGPCGAEVQSDVKGWHGRMWMIQAAFVDGHAATVRMQGHQQPEPQLGRYPDCESGDREQCHQFWHCVIFRGPGWQLDCLPAPPIQTGLPCDGGFENPIG